MKPFKKYIFNPVTLAMEQVETTARDVVRRVTWPILIGLISGVGLFFLFVMIFPSPREKQLLERYDNLRAQTKLLDEQADRMQLVLNDLQMRDDNLYRALLQAEPIPVNVRLGAARPAAYYDSIASQTNWQLSAELTRKLDIIENELYMQAKSYEEIIDYARNQEIRMENIPAIQPVLNKDLTRMASGYGWRVDPVYGTRRFHEGMDFTAPTGTDVYATGNGRIIEAGWQQGYGNRIVIDHGFGYHTLYAHLHKILKRSGTVHRGDVIGLVGSTGKSTGPHLHYEVHYHGAPVDPRNYYFQDLSPEDYDRMVQMSSNAGNMLD